MKAWTTFPRRVYCGRCGVRLEPGTRVQTLQFVGVKQTKIRCEACVRDTETPARTEPATSDAGVVALAPDESS